MDIYGHLNRQADADPWPAPRCASHQVAGPAARTYCRNVPDELNAAVRKAKAGYDFAGRTQRRWVKRRG